MSILVSLLLYLLKIAIFVLGIIVANVFSYIMIRCYEEDEKEAESVTEPLVAQEENS